VQEALLPSQWRCRNIGTTATLDKKPVMRS
jgi:hypothetical protein